MDDARKSAAAAASQKRKESRSEHDSNPGPRKESAAFVAYMNDPESRERPTAAKALDRWFNDRQKTLGAPRLLDVPNEALVTNGGPIQVTGNITLVAEDGTVTHANHVTLCRCGHSGSKPSCDESHLEKEFLNPGKFTDVSEVSPSKSASKVTLSCLKNGPVTFRGKLRLHNEYGQECVKMRGSLCRCGQSTSKPFCDGSHSKFGFRSG